MMVVSYEFFSSIIIISAIMSTPASHRGTKTAKIGKARSFNLDLDEDDFEGLLEVAPES